MFNPPLYIMYRHRLIPQAIYSLIRARASPSQILLPNRPFEAGVSSRALTSTAPDSPARPKRPSPYRLIPPHTFLADFAPLHVAGWRLDQLLPSIQPSVNPGRASIEDGMADLQDRRLIRLYEFEMGKNGWNDLMGFMSRVGEMVAEQDVGYSTLCIIAHKGKKLIRTASPQDPNHARTGLRPDDHTAYITARWISAGDLYPHPYASSGRSI
jgi:hypothetical protein